MRLGHNRRDSDTHVFEYVFQDFTVQEAGCFSIAHKPHVKLSNFEIDNANNAFRIRCRPMWAIDHSFTVINVNSKNSELLPPSINGDYLTALAISIWLALLVRGTPLVCPRALNRRNLPSNPCSLNYSRTTRWHSSIRLTGYGLSVRGFFWFPVAQLIQLSSNVGAYSLRSDCACLNMSV